MQKIISVFQRNYDGDRQIRDEIVPGAEWVANGEGVATRKYDGTCCLGYEGVLMKRYDAKQGKAPPPNFTPAQDPDPVTGHWPGWVPVGKGPEDRWHRVAFESTAQPLRDGTYELIGPHIQGNPEGVKCEMLLPHSEVETMPECPRTFEGIREYLRPLDVEGVVFHHPDGRMAKVKKKDYGMKRKP